MLFGNQILYATGQIVFKRVGRKHKRNERLLVKILEQHRRIHRNEFSLCSRVVPNLLTLDAQRVQFVAIGLFKLQGKVTALGAVGGKVFGNVVGLRVEIFEFG